MSTFTELDSNLNEHLRRTATFVRMAFHVHSPDSFDWGKRASADPKQNDRVRLKDPQVYLDHLSHNFDVVCITDHMKCGYACALAQAALKRNDIIVFPGMEVNARVPPSNDHRIHLLTIFAPQVTSHQIERIFAHQNPTLPDDSTRTGQEEIYIEDLRSFTQLVESVGGIVVLAHIEDKQRGHRAYFRTAKKATATMLLESPDGVSPETERQIAEEYKHLIADSCIHAIEISTAQDRLHYQDFSNKLGRTISIPCVAQNDAHCLEQMTERDKLTYVKIAERSFESLKEALRFPDTRIKFNSELAPRSAARIKGVLIVSPEQKGKFDKAEIAFNENLNCIIGPRGSGKSTALEAIRYVFEKSFNNKSGATSDQDSYRNLARSIQIANLTDSIITVAYETSEKELFFLTSTFDPKEFNGTRIYSISGEQLPKSERTIEKQFPIRIYSWSELEHLGRRQDLQRELIDRLIPELPELKQKKTLLVAKLKDNRLGLEQLALQLERLRGADNFLLTHYNEYRQDFERTNTPEVSSLFGELDILRERLELLQNIDISFGHIEDAYSSQPRSRLLDQIAELVSAAPHAIQEWWAGNVSHELQIDELAVEITALREKAKTLISRRRNSIRLLLEKIGSEASRKEQDIRNLVQINPAEQLQTDKRELSKKRFDSASKRRDEYLALWRAFSEKLEQRSAIGKELADTQKILSASRQESITPLQDKLQEVQSRNEIEIFFALSRDRSELSDYLEKNLLSKEFGPYKKTHLADRLSDMAIGPTLASSVLEGNSAILLSEGKKFGKDTVTRKEGELFVATLNPFSDDADSNTRVLDWNKLNSLLKLHEVPWDDELKIKLNGKPVDTLSPGQRTSAILPIVAISETVPLIIDQPEDNLDNRMVGGTFINILARLKEHRQLILATHNPNIVVGGDAEQVVVLNSEVAECCEVSIQGSIDQSDIIESVIGLMEGGREAFVRRGRRYNIQYR